MTATDLIAECHRRGVRLDPALDYEGPITALDGVLLARLRAKKGEVIRELLGPASAAPSGPQAGADWRDEWLREMGILAVRCRNTADAEVKLLLHELIKEVPRTPDEWLILGGMIRDAEVDLRRAGKLPPVPNFGA